MLVIRYCYVVSESWYSHWGENCECAGVVSGTTQVNHCLFLAGFDHYPLDQWGFYRIASVTLDGLLAPNCHWMLDGQWLQPSCTYRLPLPHYPHSQHHLVLRLSAVSAHPSVQFVWHGVTHNLDYTDANYIPINWQLHPVGTPLVKVAILVLSLLGVLIVFLFIRSIAGTCMCVSLPSARFRHAPKYRTCPECQSSPASLA